MPFVSVLFIIAGIQGTSNLPGNPVPMKVTDELILAVFDWKLTSYCTARQLKNILKRPVFGLSGVCASLPLY